MIRLKLVEVNAAGAADHPKLLMRKLNQKNLFSKVKATVYLFTANIGQDCHIVLTCGCAR
jgi:hypothetical protein